MRNPFTRIKQRFSRYLAVAICTGSISFLGALVLLHTGFSPFVSLFISVCIGGMFNYFALEMWATPKRKGKLSWKRLGASSIVGGAAFVVRWGVLEFFLNQFAAYEPYDKFMALCLSYVASFTFGYLLRSRVIFTHKPAADAGNP